MDCATCSVTKKASVVSNTRYRRTRLCPKVGLGMAGTASGRTPAQCDTYITGKCSNDETFKLLFGTLIDIVMSILFPFLSSLTERIA